MSPGIRSRLLHFRREVVVLTYALLDRGTPGRLRVAGLAILVYLLSPFDLLPELVPFIGILDDIAIVPWSMSLLLDRLPQSARGKAEARADRFVKRYLGRPLTFMVLVLLALLVVWGLVIWLAWSWLT